MIREDTIDPLGMAPDDMRRLGYKVVDTVVEHWRLRRDGPAIRTAELDDLMDLLHGPLPEEPSDPSLLISLLASEALCHQQISGHPRYLARVPSPASFAAVLGEWLGVGFNSIAASWDGGSGPSAVELTVLDWMRQMVGLADGTDGILVSGGSNANLTAFVTARSEMSDGIVYLSDQAHSSLLRDLKAMGLPSSNIRILPADMRQRMPIGALRDAVAGDRTSGRKPMMVVATAGTTNTGAVDPLNQIADLCAADDVWFHVDGAYGAPAAITAEGRDALAGMERADSLVLDPHKWLFQPYDVGACFVTRPGALERCFAMSPDYLKDVQSEGGGPNLGNRGLELTRRSRALKIWMSIRTYGARRFRSGVQHGLDLARHAEAELRRAGNRWEVLSPAQLGIVCFATRDWRPDEHRQRAKILANSGFACVSSTAVNGRSALRLCTINPMTTEEDVSETIRRLADAETQGGPYP